MKKAQYEMSFTWMFALIVGAFVLFLAIYASRTLITTEETIQDAKTSKEVSILLNPLETGFETVKASYITFPVETKVKNGCSLDGEFGRQTISVSQMSLNKWTDTDIEVGFSNKYIFSTKEVEGKTDYLFAKPFNFPFKVTDLIYITSKNEKYCFIGAPLEIENEINTIGQENLQYGNCSTRINFTRVCFSSGSKACAINVNYNAGYVEKIDGKVYFIGDSLMYAAIFTDKEVYECQIKRLMKRVSILSSIYIDKATIIAKAGCSTTAVSSLNLLKSSAESLQGSIGLNSFNQIIKTLGDDNSENSKCKLW